MKICTVEDCTNKVLAKGYCKKHYYTKDLPNAKVCCVKECNNRSLARGICKLHYSRSSRWGAPIKDNIVCYVKGCNRKTKDKGLCSQHLSNYIKFKNPIRENFKTKEEGYVKPDTNFEKTCTVNGCDKLIAARGLCWKHYKGRPGL